jgi:hypothetical protein
MLLREAGVSFEEIARQLGYRSRGSAYHAVIAGLKAAREESARSLRRLEERRLNRLWLAAFPRAVSNPPDLEAIDKCIKIMARRAAYRGLDPPKDLRLTGKDGGAIRLTLDQALAADQELEEWEREQRERRGQNSSPADRPPVSA